MINVIDYIVFQLIKYTNFFITCARAWVWNIGYLPKEAMKTATTDQGKEFSYYTALGKEPGIQVYVEDAYFSW